MEEPGHNLEAASFGIGALPNCFFALLNVYDSHAKRDNAAIEPGVDPGSGAFSVFHDRQGFAKKQIKAGEEIFVDYGYGYFEGDREEIFGLIPFLGSYKAADTLLKGFRAVSQRLVDRLSPGHKKSPADYGSHDISVSLYELLKSVIMTWPSRTQGALPASSRDVSHVLDDLGSTMYIHAQRSKRPVDWLEEHGTCMDHLVIRNSAIPHAGRGAFANKFLPKGSIVAPVPLIHIPRREVMNMYDGYITSQPSAPQYRRNASKILHRQLMLNYCFGHRESSLLLCPYGIASALVNHGSSKTKQANAKIVWSNKTTSRPEWFDMPLEAWARKYQAGLAFDYVAFRDIQEGEEILIDYGDEWQAAWDAHVSKWTPKIFPSQTLNMAVDPIEIPTHDEWPWPDVHLWCRSIYRDFQGLPLADGEAFPCRIISKTKDHGTGEIHYNAELRERSYGVKNEPKLKDIDYCYEVFDEILFSLPRDAFIFGNAYDWEEHNRYYGETWSFRHDLRIPDNIMPKMWKDLSLM